jgi:hypothetical protein
VRRFLVAVLLAAGCATASRGPNVVLVTLDGTRWQEVFRGADQALLGTLEGKDGDAVRAAFWRESAEERRRALLPFLWGTVAREGQLVGNADRGSEVLVTNAFKFSYPGYHELLCGFPSTAIVSNDKVPNPDVTVLEWLGRRPAFQGSVAAFASWDVFPFILNSARAGIPVNVGEPLGPRTLFDRLRDEVQAPWHGSVYDAFVFHAAMDYLDAHTPRAFYVALGDTDEWAHAGHYDRYLQHLRRVDGWLAELWGKLQSAPAYRGRTSLVVTTDHGRGDGPEGWRRHGVDAPGSDHVWVALLGPAAAAAGERTGHAPLTQAQVAATVAALVGEDYAGAQPGVAGPLPLGR